MKPKLTFIGLLVVLLLVTMVGCTQKEQREVTDILLSEDKEPIPAPEPPPITVPDNSSVPLSPDTLLFPPETYFVRTEFVGGDGPVLQDMWVDGDKWRIENAPPSSPDQAVRLFNEKGQFTFIQQPDGLWVCRLCVLDFPSLFGELTPFPSDFPPPLPGGFDLFPGGPPPNPSHYEFDTLMEDQLLPDDILRGSSSGDTLRGFEPGDDIIRGSGTDKESGIPYSVIYPMDDPFPLKESWTIDGKTYDKYYLDVQLTPIDDNIFYAPDGVALDE